MRLNYDCETFEDMLALSPINGQLGFCIHVSQQGLSVNLPNGRTRRQRALVRGFMLSSLAEYVYDKINDIEHLVARTSRQEMTFSDPCKLGSATFTGNAYESDYTSQDLSEPLYKEYSYLRDYCYPNLEPVDVVDVQIFDIRWDNNSLLWSSLHSVLSSYTK